MASQRQGTVLFSGILFFVVTTVVLQLWLMTVSLEALLKGESHTLIPAAAASSVLFLVNAGMLRYVLRFDSKLHNDE